MLMSSFLLPTLCSHFYSAFLSFQSYVPGAAFPHVTASSQSPSKHMDKCLSAELSFMSGLQDLMCSLAFLVHLSKPMGLWPWVLFICGLTFLNEHVQPSLCSLSGFSSSPPVAVPLFWQCSRTCGGGRQKRHISCPREGHCDWTQRPGAIASCSRQPCTLWVHQAWSPVGFSLFLFYFLGRVGRIWLYYPLVSEPQRLWQVQFLMHKSCKRRTSENITELFTASPHLFLQVIDNVASTFCCCIRCHWNLRFFYLV